MGKTSSTFAAVFGDGSVKTYARRHCWIPKETDCKDCITGIQATSAAVAAISAAGRVTTWLSDADHLFTDDDNQGEDSTAVESQLRQGVREVQANDRAFAAILSDGSVVTWGDDGQGGDSSHVQPCLKNVKCIQATATAFAAILEDGSVVTWGDEEGGGDSTEVQHQLRNIRCIQRSRAAFAAISDLGSVITWGCLEQGGDSRSVAKQLKGVQSIQASDQAFAAILVDGSVVTWGNPPVGGDSKLVQQQLKHVQCIQSTIFSFAAITAAEILLELVLQCIWIRCMCLPGYLQSLDMNCKRTFCHHSKHAAGQWVSGVLGPPFLWRKGHGLDTSAIAASSTDPGQRLGICCHSRRWICCHVGRRLLWWEQRPCSGKAKESTRDPGHNRGFRRLAGRWGSF